MNILGAQPGDRIYLSDRQGFIAIRATPHGLLMAFVVQTQETPPVYQIISRWVTAPSTLPDSMVYLGAAAPSARVPTKASLRLLLDVVLPMDADLDAFCLDHFEATFRRFSSGMERKIKITLLLASTSAEAILACLRANSARLVERHQDLLDFE